MTTTGERRPRSGRKGRRRGRRGLWRRVRPTRTTKPSAGIPVLPESSALPEQVARGVPVSPVTPAPSAPPVNDGRPARDRGTSPPPAPDVDLQINALQALCRQVFGFRLAMIALAAPAALLNAGPGWGVRLVGIAVVVTFMGSYVLVRDWERFGPLLLRHPSLLAVDTLFGSLLLVSAGPDSLLAYAGVCTPLLAGLVYGWRGAAAFASLQGLILLLVHATLADTDPHRGLTETLFLPGLCVIAGAVGSSLRNLMLRFGTATRALTAVQARLAATEAVGEERARLAREMHDSVAKTLYGVALAADGLAGSASAGHVDVALVRQQAELVARSARRAAAESRELLADLRGEPPRGAAAGTGTGKGWARERTRGRTRGRTWTYWPNWHCAHATSAPAPASRRHSAGPATARTSRTALPRSPCRWPARSSPLSEKPWRTPIAMPARPGSPSARVFTAACSASSSTTTAAASRPARTSNNSAGTATSAWSAWSSARRRSAPASASAEAPTHAAPRSAWNSLGAPKPPHRHVHDSGSGPMTPHPVPRTPREEAPR